MAKSRKIRLTVSKWGNSLAVRLPADSAKQLGVDEGDTLEAEVYADGRMVVAPEVRAIDRAAARALRRFVGNQPETAPVVADMRGKARY